MRVSVAGLMRETVCVERLEVDAGTFGEVVEEWIPEGAESAAVQPLSGVARESLARQGVEATHVVYWLPGGAVADSRVKWRFRWGDRYLVPLQGVRDEGGAGQVLSCLCVEAQA